MYIIQKDLIQFTRTKLQRQTQIPNSLFSERSKYYSFFVVGPLKQLI